MIFHFYSHSAQKAFEHYRSYISGNEFPVVALLDKKALLCPFDITLIATDSLDLDGIREEKFKEIVVSLHHAWQIICRDVHQGINSQIAWDKMMQDCIGIPMPFSSQMEWNRQIPNQPRYLKLLRLREDKPSRHFFLLLDGHEITGIGPAYINLLVLLWQLEQGKLPVHAAGIIRNERLFLFAGRSGSGKSTIVALSQGTYGQTLDEDQVLIFQKNGYGFIAEGWGYGITTSVSPLTAIFEIIQSKEDKLVPLRQVQTARLLMTRHLEAGGAGFPASRLEKSLNYASSIARHVAGYQLFFRKSPDFWKLIDEQFPV